MKKLFIVLVISSLGFIGCNNTATGSSEGDSTSIESSLGNNPPANPTDTMVNLDTTSEAATDTASF